FRSDRARPHRPRREGGRADSARERRERARGGDHEHRSRSPLGSSPLRAAFRGPPEAAEPEVLKKALFAIAALGVAAALFVGYAVWRTFPRESGSVKVPGHAAPIALALDAHGVPTIRAQSIPDAMFGLGYAHARDRLWQMEFERRVGSGRPAGLRGTGLWSAGLVPRT